MRAQLLFYLSKGGCEIEFLVREKSTPAGALGQVAERAGLSRNDASRAVETMLEIITSTLKRGDEVRLVGFGNFSVTRRKPSTGRNPRTGEPMEIKASSQPKFRPGKALKDAVQ